MTAGADTANAWVPTTPDACEPGPAARRRRRFRDAPHWILVAYGLTQAVVTTLMVFEVVQTTTFTSAVTAVALILYVAVSELLAGPRARRGSSEPRP